MDVDECITQIKHGCLLPDHTILELCFLSKSLLCLESNVVAITSPVTVCGCIHGQLHDLLHLIEINGQLPDVQYLFLGNYVGRGAHQIETVCLLLLMKVKYPDRIHLLRGNHETRTMSQSYGLYDECIKKYGSTTLWSLFNSLFDVLPLSAVIDNSVFCVHGGLSPHLRIIDQVRYCVVRNEEICDGLACDLLWSDPDDNVSGMQPKSKSVGHLFGGDCVAKFCCINKIDMIARSHQFEMSGYKYHFDNKLVTVWSAPNYMRRYNNVAATMTINNTPKPVFVVFGVSTGCCNSVLD